MICRVHGQRFGVVVDGDIDRAAECLLQARAGAATAGEVVDDQLIAQVERHGEEVALHAAAFSSPVIWITLLGAQSQPRTSSAVNLPACDRSLV